MRSISGIRSQFLFSRPHSKVAALHGGVWNADCLALPQSLLHTPRSYSSFMTLRCLGCLADARLRVMVTIAESRQKQLLLTVPLCTVRGKPRPRDEAPAKGPVSMVKRLV